ncbi:cupin domain-containing protein [Ensifer sp. SL37]|uniref:cupin domain-containing protein n=1 Tax=Ensifer sp. SL37 TaxID=2995137 RepID=UPI00227429E5|nr:cupin domain-containing protein [Ensifer sp. SL37]MCY1740377.1 cupin domain-containing protein [Ensifer sp. SL37]
MSHQNLDQMTNGWFIGNFDPSLLKTDVFEVGVKRYKAGDEDPKHFHKIAREITVIVSGRVFMFDREWSEGSIIDIPPGVPSSFRALTDAVVTVVKVPSVAGDKYLLEES